MCRRKRMREYISTYYHKNKEPFIKDYNKHYLRCWATDTISNHRSRGIKVEVTIPFLKELAGNTPNCMLCGIEFHWFNRNGKIAPDSPTLDRVDNEKIITESNIMIICRKCNTTKQDRTFNEFVEYCRMIITKFPTGILVV
jgi:hypothetical protein